MGDSPSVAWLLHGTPSDPTQPSWGGQFIRIWDDRRTVFDQHTTATDKAEAFGVVVQPARAARLHSAHVAMKMAQVQVPEELLQIFPEISS